MSAKAVTAVMFLCGSGSARLSHDAPLLVVLKMSWFVTRIIDVSDRSMALTPKKTPLPYFANANVSFETLSGSRAGGRELAQP